MLGNFGILTVGEAVARLLSFVALIWLTRQLSLGDFGLVALGGNLVVFFSMIVTSSTQAIGLRDAARSPERFKAVLEPLLGVRLAMAVAGMAVFAVVALAVGRDADERVVLALFALVLPMMSLNLRFSVLVLGSARSVAVANIASQAVFVGLVVLLVDGPGDAFYVPLAQMLSELGFAALLLAHVAPKVGRVLPRVELATWARHLRETAPLMATQAGRATISWFDSLLIAAVLGRAQVGLYSAAYRPVLFIGYSLSLLLMSFLASYAGSKSPTVQRALLARTVRLTTALATAAAVVLAVAAEPIVALLFGSAYADAALPAAILSLTIPLLCLGSVYAMVLLTHGRQDLVLRHTLIGTALNVAANLVVVPLAGISGAATVTVISWGLIVWGNHRSCRRLGYT